MAIAPGRPSALLWLLAGLPLVVAACKPSPSVAFDPPRWDFGTVAFGLSATQTVTVTNNSGYTLQIALFNADPGIEVAGLPISNLAPKASAQLEINLSPMFNETASFNESVSLLIGGYSGGEWGDLSAVANFDVSGEVTVAQVCIPAPTGYASQIGELNGGVDYIVAQDGYACTPEGAPDGGSSCRTASECTSFCCRCPLDCADYTAQACVNGSCTRAPLACDVAQSVVSVMPALCPDGGHPPSTVLGPLGFDVAGSGAQLGSTLTVTLSRDAPSACLDAGRAPGLSFALGSEIEPHLFVQFGSGGASALLDDPTLGSLDAVRGYAYLTEASASGVAGSFDLFFEGSSTQEAWGNFNAPICP